MKYIKEKIQKLDIVPVWNPRYKFFKTFKNWIKKKKKNFFFKWSVTDSEHTRLSSTFLYNYLLGFVSFYFLHF